MDVFRTDRIRNVVLLGHSGSGKTSLTEAMAYLSGMTNRLGKVTDGNTVSDWAKEEMGWAVAAKLIQGHDNGTLEPQGNATRAQAAAVFQRFDENILN